MSRLYNYYVTWRQNIAYVTSQKASKGISFFSTDENTNFRGPWCRSSCRKVLTLSSSTNFLDCPLTNVSDQLSQYCQLSFQQACCWPQISILLSLFFTSPRSETRGLVSSPLPIFLLFPQTQSENQIHNRQSPEDVSTARPPPESEH